MGLGYGMRTLIGQPKVLTATLLVLTLIPWFKYHQLILRQDVAVGIATYIGPGIVMLTIIGALFLEGRARLTAAFIPVAAFLVTRYVTIPMVIDVLPPDEPVLYDNMRTIWPAMWTVGATALLLAYAWPIPSARLPASSSVD